ncbi:AIR synthase related protein [Actinoplanes xinjiangensis]|uniref:AIR synthase related protein n=1 Tax=Actinoplanes xinjiangensis TaxID=512350 RepID=A0A316E901_9ACTN|nr:AIR synthase related protein [Actinoplanes xinjiangensis]
MLGVHGTVNDLAMRSAMPVAYVVEEGLPLTDLRRVAASVGAAAVTARVSVVTGDTKVVGRGAADRMFVVTAGLGRRLPGAAPTGAGARPEAQERPGQHDDQLGATAGESVAGTGGCCRGCAVLHDRSRDGCHVVGGLPGGLGADAHGEADVGAAQRGRDPVTGQRPGVAAGDRIAGSEEAEVSADGGCSTGGRR